MEARDRMESAERVRMALDDADEVLADQIDVVLHGDRIVLRGWVSSPDEAAAAQHIADSAAGLPQPAVNELQIDANLREGVDEARSVERSQPAENEVLVGDPDMLAGPDSAFTDQMDQAFGGDEPMVPPDMPVYPAQTSDQGGSRETITTKDDDEREIVLEATSDRPSAPDISYEELHSARSGQDLPSLDPDATPQRSGRAEPDPAGVSELGRAPEDGLGSMPEPVPGTEPGPGAIGEHALRGGSTGAIPATETGAIGADTAHADPARAATGDTAKIAGTHRGPETREDPPLREDMPTDDPEGA